MSHNQTATPLNPFVKSDMVVLAGLSAIPLVYHLLTGAFSSYGYFIDELYYLACSKRLAFGYVDHPPLSILLLALNRVVLGDSIVAMRFLPALAISATVFTTGLITLRLGGSRIALVIASLAVIAAPDYLLMGSFYSMNAFEILIWTIILYLAVKIVQEDNPAWMFAIGILMGVGLEMKHTMILYAIALIVALMLTPARRYLWNRWVFWAMLSCIFLVLPNFIWQIMHGYPSLEFYRNATINKNIQTSPVAAIFAQILFINPLAFPLWFAGLIYFLVSDVGKKYRFLGLGYLVLLLVLIVSQSSRPDRIAAMYTVLFAGGAVALDKIRHTSARRSVSTAMIVMLIAGAVLAAPLSSPLLPPPALQTYMAAIGFKFSVESGKTGDPLPQWIGDRLGWRELASEVSRVYHSLPAEEQRNTVIVSTNYGEAGALELYGPEFGLPPVYATHNSYHLWGPPADSVRTCIVVFVSRADIEKKFDSVVEAGVQTCDYCTRPQRRIPIYVARGPRFSIAKEWPNFKIYD